MGGYIKLEKLKAKMLGLQQEVNSHRNAEHVYAEKSIDESEQVARTAQELAIVTAEYKELIIERDYHEKTQYCRYGNSGDYHP